MERYQCQNTGDIKNVILKVIPPAGGISTIPQDKRVFILKGLRSSVGRRRPQL